MQAVFLNSLKRSCANLPRYYVRSDEFDLIQRRGEDNKAFNRRQIRWYLENYQALKDAAQGAEVKALFDELSKVRSLPVSAATAYGWFDLQIGVPSFGPLPSEDQAMLADLNPGPTNPLKDLMGGVIEIESMDIIRELNAALIAYTPPQFEVIDCQIRLGDQDGKPALFYNINCPQFPDEGTTVVNDRVHSAATRLVREMTPQGSVFPGIALHLELQKDGSWRHSLSRLQ